jgi:hypothetical protein
MATMPLTQAAIQRLAAMLSAGAPSATQPYDYSPPKRLPGLNSQVRSATQLETAVPPAPEQGPAPNFGPPPAASGGAPAVSPEGIVNQSPPMPNPPLAAAPPPVASQDFGRMMPGAAQNQPGVIVNAAAPNAAAPNAAAMPAPVGTDPSMADETVRQTLARVMKPKMLPAQWAANFGSLADQQT